jgi:hypothetical protein
MGFLDAILSLLYPGRQYGVPSRTRQGVEVRSRAELRIADYFDRARVRYEYEREVRAGFWIFTSKVSCPDFYLPDHDLYVEYWGMLDVDDARDRDRYERTMKYKMARYHQLGIKFISLYPRDLDNLDQSFRQKFMEATGQELA